MPYDFAAIPSLERDAMQYVYDGVTGARLGIRDSHGTVRLFGSSTPNVYVFAPVPPLERDTMQQVIDSANGGAVVGVRNQQGVVTLFGGGAAVAAPGISTQPAAASVGTGATATFSVVATGAGPFSYTWRKFLGGVLSTVGTNADTYTTPTLSSTDDGAVFSVVVSNAGGSNTSAGAALTVTGVDSRPRFWYGAAADYQGGNIAAAFGGATPLTGSANGGRSGSFTAAASGTQYVWIAVLQSAVTGGSPSTGIRVFDGLGYGGFQGAGSAGDYAGADADPSTSSTTYAHSSGTYLLFRSAYRGVSGVTLTVS